MTKWTNEQLDAINKAGCNIIVSAGAGSGKTAVLTERVITKIKNGCPINRLLILTFTKAAANEMRERIRQSLQEQGLKEQLELLDSSYITTFDSYALSIVKKYHYLSNISRNIDIGDSNIFKIQKYHILNEIFEGLYKEKNKDFINLISDFCIKDDEEIRNYILDIYSKVSLKIDSFEYLNNYINTTYSNENIEEITQKYNTLLMNNVYKIREILEQISFVTENAYYNKLKDSLSQLINATTYEEIRNGVDLKLPLLPRGSDETLKELKEKINKIIKKLKELTIYNNLGEIRNNINDTKQYATIIVSILINLDLNLKKFKHDNNIYEFTDIALLAIKIIEENAGDREELKNSFEEILLDEYQDTSDIQEKFISLIDNNNVYMVGDIKQSIYRFRNANPYIFKSKYDKYSKNNDGIKIDLNKNFRSRKEVIDSINILFNQIMGDEIGGAEYKESHQMIFGNKAYLENGKLELASDMQIINYGEESVEYNKNEIEAFIIANDIKNKINNNYKVFDKKNSELRTATYSDFVILMDRSTDFELYKKVFEYSKIPMTIYKDEVINSEIDILVLKNLLDLIKHIKEKNYDTRFKYLFVSVARSFLIELSDQELYEIVSQNNFYSTSIFKQASSISNKIDYLTPCQLLEEVIDTYNVYENLIKIGNVKESIIRIDYLLNLSRQLEKIGYNCYTFVDYLNEIEEKDYDMKYTSELEDVDAVKIMTIHKSKGLEYPICYFSGLYKKFNVSDLKDKIIFDNNFGIIIPTYKNGIVESVCKPLVKEDYIKEEISEKIRLFYVALTRTREKIIIILPQGKQSFNDKISNNIKLEYRSIMDMIYSLGSLINSYIQNIEVGQLGLTKNYLYTSVNDFKCVNDKQFKKLDIDELDINVEYIDKKRFSKSKNELYSQDNRKNIDLGLQFHSILENISFTSPRYDLIENEFIRKKVQQFLSQLGDLTNQKIYKEYEFDYDIDNTNYHGIIDLILEGEKQIKIIDYKLKSVTDNAYIKQLMGYKKYIEKISKKPIIVYLYSIFDGQLEELT